MAEDIMTRLTAEFLKSLSHPARIRILRLLAPGERCVCELIAEIDIEQSNLSQHLSVLKKQGIIDSRKEGTKVIYRIMHPSVLEVINAVEKTIGDQLTESRKLLSQLGKGGIPNEN
jgi:DNA-binding transcriptional ArsR family regulator